MARKEIKIDSKDGSEFDCYVSMPDRKNKVPAIVIACAVYGVDLDVRKIADEFAANGYIAYAPDLFWRTLPGPLLRGDARTQERSQPRLEKIKAGEQDMLDVAAEIRKLPQSNGRIATIGLCYGGPYAVIAPQRLGYNAGISCHGTTMASYVNEFEGLTAPVCYIWGDQDHAATPEVQDVYPKLAQKIENLEVHLLPGILHGYMNTLDKATYDAGAYKFSMQRALSILETLQG